MQTRMLNLLKHQLSLPVFVRVRFIFLLFVIAFSHTTLKAANLAYALDSSLHLVKGKGDKIGFKVRGGYAYCPTGPSGGYDVSKGGRKANTISPQILGLFPENTDQYVEQDVKPEIHFDTDVLLGDGLIELYNAETGVQLKALDLATGTGISQPEAHMVKLDFGVLELNTSYYILFAEGSFKDSQGNPAAGFAASTDWSFHTVENAEPLLVIESEENPLDFGKVAAGTESEPKVYRLGGRNISIQVALEVPEEFVYSVNGGSSYIRGDTVHFTSIQLENYREVWVKFAPLEENGETYQLEVKHYSEELDTVRLGLFGKEESLPEPVSIAEARHLEVGRTVRVSGVVTDGRSFGQSRRFFEDGSAGLAVFSEDLATISTLNRGDSILLEGQLELNESGLLQLGGKNLSVELLKSGAEQPLPFSTYVEEWNSSLESRLLEVQNIRFVNAGDHFAENQSYSFTDTKGAQGVVKITGTSNPLIGTIIPGIATVRGNLSKEEDYLLLPRDEADLEEQKPEVQYSLPDGKLYFGFVVAGAQSNPLPLRISGRDLAEPIELKVDAPFELSMGEEAYSQSLTLPADAREVEVLVRFAPQEASMATYKQLLTIHSSPAAVVAVEVVGIEGAQPEFLSLQQARVMPLGEEIKVKGIITSGRSISASERFMQDTTAGIVLVTEDKNIFESLEVGTELQLKGILQEQDGRLQLQGDLQWEVLDANAGDPAGIEANAVTEANESRLLQFIGVEFLSQGAFEGNTSYEAKLPSGDKVWVQLPTADHPLVGSRIPFQATVKGVLANTINGYRLLPRLLEDLKATDAVLATGFPDAELEFFFVPAGTVSEVKELEVSGLRLEGAVSLETQAPFEISTDGTHFGYTASLEISNSATEAVYVRYAPSNANNSLSKGQLRLAPTNGWAQEVYLTGIEGERPEVLPIAQARALGAEENVRVQGVLISSKDFFAAKRFLQDTTGALLLVADAAIFEGFNAGDKVEVSGTLAESANMLELSGELNIELLEDGAGVPAALEITAAEQLSEENEGRLLKLPSIQFTQTGRFEEGRRYPIALKGGEEVFVRISGDAHPLAGEFIPLEASLTVLLVQEEDNYLLLPRNAADMEVVSYPAAIVLRAPENGYDFGYVRAGKLSSMEVCWVSSLGLEDSITISVGEPFLLATDTTRWSRELKFEPHVNQAHLYIRFSPSEASGGHYTSDLYFTSNGLHQYVPVEGREGAVSGMVHGPDFQEDFESCPGLGGFATFDGDGLAQWECSSGRGVDQSSALGIRIAGGEPEANSDWLISPRLSITRGSLLSFDVARQTDGPVLELLVSADYSGSGNPQHASWKPVSIEWPETLTNQRITSPNSYHSVSKISLAGFAGQEVYLAFRYTASYETAAAWLIDNFKVAESPLAGFPEAEGKIQEGGSTTYRLALSKPVAQQSTLTLQFNNSEGLVYGENKDYVTNPPLTDGLLVLQLAAGAQEVGFTLSALEDLLHEDVEKLSVSLLEVGEGLLADGERMHLNLAIGSNNARDMTIPAIREVNDKGLLVHQNSLVRVKGVAYGPNLSLNPNGLEFRVVEQAEGERKGIVISLEAQADIGYSLQEGDELQVIGVVRNEEGLAVLHPQQIDLFQEDVPLEEAQPVATLNEENESALLVLESVEVVSGWQNAPSRAFMIKVRNREGTEFLVQIRPATDLFGTELLSTKLNITGFGVQKDEAAPYDGGYYLLARRQADFQWITETGLSAKPEDAEWLLYPNPATKTLLIKAEEKHLFERVQVYSLSGRLLQEHLYRSDAALDVSELKAGTYLLKILLKGGGYSVRRFTISR